MTFQVSLIKQEEFQLHPLLARLLELSDVPKQLYVAGTLPTVTLDEYGRASPRILSIVGSRKHTQYGKHAVEKLVSSISSEDVIVVSGLAYGIDSIAHTSALKNNLKTFAILANGINEKVIYPKSHVHLVEEIINSGGVIISEYAPDTEAREWQFPARNRIVAALSDAVMVGEADEKSGTLITARQALELGRDIGAIPGDIFSPTSRGTNMLIRDGAYILANDEDLFSLLHLSKSDSQEDVNTYNEEESCILNLLSEPISKDTLFIKSEMTFEKFLGAMSSLEIKGVIEETFGEVRRIV